ncbi:hypothetical protein Bca101_045547 [Brassica carinata]
MSSIFLGDLAFASQWCLFVDANDRRCLFLCSVVVYSSDWPSLGFFLVVFDTVRVLVLPCAFRFSCRRDVLNLWFRRVYDYLGTRVKQEIILFFSPVMFGLVLLTLRLGIALSFLFTLACLGHFFSVDRKVEFHGCN